MKTIISAMLISCLSFYAHSFEGGEHALIGNKAFELYFPEYKNEFQNLESEMRFNYGQLIAMSGDMYESVEELALDDPRYLGRFFNNNRKHLKKCINQEIEAILNSDTYTRCEDLKLASRKPGYITLAHDNYDHFAWHNLKKYIELHEQALWFANLAHLKCTKKERKKSKKSCNNKNDQLNKIVDDSHYDKRLSKKYTVFSKVLARKKFTKSYLKKLSKDKLIRLSFYTNAFADHYLSDAFSTGHLRIPRSQIDAYVSDDDLIKQKNTKKKRKEGSTLSGALTQYLHNIDGKNTGLIVTNSERNEFIIRGDKQLFAQFNSDRLLSEKNKFTFAQKPIEAVYRSIKEIMDVIEQGEGSSPATHFSALQLVPFIEAAKSNSLHQLATNHLNDSGSPKKAMEAMSSEVNTLFKAVFKFKNENYKTYFKTFVHNIDDIMLVFKQKIQSESVAPIYSKRIPQPLLTALRNIQ